MGAASIAAGGIQTVGGIYSAYGAREAGRAQEGYYRYLASAKDFEAAAAEVAGQQGARSIQDAAALEYARYTRDVKRLEGQQRTAAAAQGVAGSVTAEDIARDTANRKRIDEAAIRAEANQRAGAVVTQAGLASGAARGEARGFRSAAGTARRAGDRAFLSTLIGTAASVSSTALAAMPSRKVAPSKTPTGGKFFRKIDLIRPKAITQKPKGFQGFKGWR